ncbi:MAG: DUF488 domain-containing protein [Pseudolabrys sp.]
MSGSQIAYENIAELGDLRPRSRDIAPTVNGFWKNQSFHNYADYAMSSGFQSGLGRLRELGSVRRCVVMCAEAVWWRCHRRIITDYLLAAGEQVFHIMGPGKIVRATLTKVARPQAGPDRMSALGQKRTFAVQKGMSALPPKADIRQSRDRRTASDDPARLGAGPGFVEHARE